MKNLDNKHLFEAVTIIVVLYKSTNIIFECLKNLRNFKIVIVDNGRNGTILEEIRSNYSSVKIIKNKKNLGFGKSVNKAVQEVGGEYFLILGPDCIVNENILEKLLDFAKKFDAAAVGPWIKDDKSCYGLLPEKGKNIPRNELQKKSAELLNNKKPDGECCVEVHKSAALLIEKRKFIDIGMFNESYFLFWEEIDLCRKYLKMKQSIILSPNIEVIHKESSSVKNDLNTFLLKIFHHELSPLIYFGVGKLSKIIYIRIFKYFIRGILYLLVFNVKNSLKNFVKLAAVFSYFFK